MIVQSPDFGALLQGGRKLVSFELPEVNGSRSFQSRAAVTTSDIGGTIHHTGAPIIALERITVADLIAPGTTGTGTVRYPRENS